jgi:hypothetical protein
VAQHPLSQQCSATSKQSGKRCRRRTIAANICWVHGVNAKQVKARREQRLALFEATRNQPATVIERREPEQVLLDALHDTNITLQQIKAELSVGVVSPPLLMVAGEWLDRLGRLGKIVIDGELENRLEARRTRRIEVEAHDRADFLTGLFVRTLQSAPISATARLAAWDAFYGVLQEVHEQQVDPRLDGEQVRAFARELERATAEERAAEIVEDVEEDNAEDDDDGVLADVSYLWPGDGGSVA